ncbi:atrial natriuretic peptide-converting enzyme isoform X2 [Ornithorhynchus anatinus]|uniref:atrial natriuretic peptide-converting enzyme isoform X2 n=1 Tax=Ornithorhynchus anatinus TaxID=9258 RepID=UPI0010A92B64|nr:atrial natriuretic peptide-converting enzyme isoform X2 [Ornithorhynchus anatinus]
MFSLQQVPAPPPAHRSRPAGAPQPASVTEEEEDLGDDGPKKVAPNKSLHLYLLVLISGVCSLALLLATLLPTLLPFEGSGEEACQNSSGEAWRVSTGPSPGPTIPRTNLLPGDPNGVALGDPLPQTTAGTTTPLEDRTHRDLRPLGSLLWNSSTPRLPVTRTPLADSSQSLLGIEEETDRPTPPSSKLSSSVISSTAVLDVALKKGACVNITTSQCRKLPYNHTTLTSALSLGRGVELAKFLKFFSYLSRLDCYRHIMLFGCSLAVPQCVGDGDDSRGLLPCQSFCEAAREGCEPVLRLVNSSWPELLRCSRFPNGTGGDSIGKDCFSPESEGGKQGLCGGGGGGGEEESFACASGMCLPLKLRCNGFNDCGDWSDEDRCNCSEGLFRCQTGKCLNASFVCDGYDDCGDLSDEQSCACSSGMEHRCGDGRCVSMAWVCDGDHDCADKSDEVNCYQAPCPEGDPPCHLSPCSGPCPGLCPGDSETSCGQCEPVTLELCLNVPYNHTRFPNFLGHQTQKEASVSWEASMFPALVQTHCYKFLMFFACTILVPECDLTTGHRLPPCRALCEQAKERCESVLGVVGLQWPEDVDCTQFPDTRSSNETCLVPGKDVQECSPKHFQCRSGRCVLEARRCDGQADCTDGSDEEDCGCSVRGLWECPASKLCIQPTVVCDGFPDCPDQMDERNCSWCQEDELECANHACVARDLWCDGQLNCADGSDEWDCVTLSKAGDSPTFLTVRRSAADHDVCADEWEEPLSHLACQQMGLGEASRTEMVRGAVPRESGQWLNLLSDWQIRRENATRLRTPLQGLLSAGQTCQSQSKVSLLCAQQDCGRRPMARLNTRVVGGRTSRPGRWPWQCSLQTEPSGHICGCVLITKRWVLTVAHCFEGRETSTPWKVVLGLSNLDQPSAHTQTRLVKNIVLHPRYSQAVVDYDISLVELSEDVGQTNYVQPVCLPRPGQLVEPDTYCSITGWGHVGHKMPFKLQEGEVRIIASEQCQSFFDVKTITARMLCAGFEAGTVDSCMGDSGGPLVCESTGGRWTLFGLTSWGSVCFSKLGGPGVYSNISHFVHWIQRQLYIRTFLLH